MESLNGIAFFVQAAEMRSFSEAGRILGVSSSAVGKGIARLEQHLGVRLFHRSTRSITLTAEGSLFLERCRRILCELESAESEICASKKTPQGRIRLSLPIIYMFVMPVLIQFMRQYPTIELDIDFSDRVVDIIDEGFDIVMRTGELSDSRLRSRLLGHFHLQIVASPEYLTQYGIPETPADLLQHKCLKYKFPTTGKFEGWPLIFSEGDKELILPTTMSCNTVAALLDAVQAGLGISCLPDFIVKEFIEQEKLVVVLEQYTVHQGNLSLLWPSSKHLTPKLRVFIDFMVEHLCKDWK
ncbi:LysR family transcriptional regulator [Acinetobacter sp. ANC 4558]|uniref:LysR family transcriptional regulator n=1 Tax=Acinetobacter sp. ANC 4558 TaxID=1977876 RepID=UPI000A35C0B5|nr:LysR family transcriptional regulator [Acinetobacter sp. ANC 4558]OTG85372.1 LysR family transcriptional regulator [Acinetobacter sp. ANC 4558]